MRTVTEIEAIRKVESRRREGRRESVGHAVLKVTHSDDASLTGQCIHCKVIEVTAGVIRLGAYTMVPGGSKVWIMLSVDKDNQRFFLAAEVRWVSFEESDEFNFGAEITDNAATDYRAWNAYILKNA